MNVGPDFVRGLAIALQQGGTNGEFIYADDPTHTGIPIRFLLSHPGRRDEAIVNAYGVNALVFTIPATTDALQATPPKKFDIVKVRGHAYVIDAVILHQADDTPVAWTTYSKGKAQ